MSPAGLRRSITILVYLECLFFGLMMGVLSGRVQWVPDILNGVIMWTINSLVSVALRRAEEHR